MTKKIKLTLIWLLTSLFIFIVLSAISFRLHTAPYIINCAGQLDCGFSGVGRISNTKTYTIGLPYKYFTEDRLTYKFVNKSSDAKPYQPASKWDYKNLSVDIIITAFSVVIAFLILKRLRYNKPSSKPSRKKA